MARKTTGSQGKGLNQEPMSATSGSDSISGSPVSGWNSQKGSDLARDVELVAGNDLEFSSEVGSEPVPAGASVYRTGDGDSQDDDSLREQILAKIHDLGDTLDRVTDRIAGDGAISDALQRLKGRYGRPHGDHGRNTTNRDFLI